MKLLTTLLLGSSLSIVLLASPALASKVALVIGNADYTASPLLDNPLKDARVVAKTFEDLGFDVILAEDVNQREFADLLLKFETDLEGAEVAAFYFAGHGIQYDGQNYLVSVDAELTNPYMLPGETIGLERIVQTMEAHSPLNLLFIDACRRNQFGAKLVRGPTPVEGLAPTTLLGKDTLVMYATASNEVAFDGEGDNSPFANSLVQHLPAPDTEIGIAMKRVIRDVRKATDGLQSPEMLTTVAQELYLKVSPEIVPAALQRGDELVPAGSNDQDAQERMDALLDEGLRHRLADRPGESLTAYLNARNLAAWYFGENSIQYAQASNHLVGALTSMNRLQDAIYAATESIRVYSLLLGADSTAVLNEKNNLAGRLHLVGRDDAALALVEEIIATFESTVRAKEDPALYAYVMQSYANILSDLGRSDEALEWSRRAIAVEVPPSEIKREIYGHIMLDHASTLANHRFCSEAAAFAEAAAKVYLGIGYTEASDTIVRARRLARGNC